MKIELEGKERCVGITSAHVLDTYRKVMGNLNYFTQLPKLFYEAGVDEVLFHERIMDAEVNTGIIINNGTVLEDKKAE